MGDHQGLGREKKLEKKRKKVTAPTKPVLSRCFLTGESGDRGRMNRGQGRRAPTLWIEGKVGEKRGNQRYKIFMLKVHVHQQVSEGPGLPGEPKRGGEKKKMQEEGSD